MVTKQDILLESKTDKIGIQNRVKTEERRIANEDGYDKIRLLVLNEKRLKML